MYEAGALPSGESPSNRPQQQQQRRQQQQGQRHLHLHASTPPHAENPRGLKCEQMGPTSTQMWSSPEEWEILQYGGCSAAFGASGLRWLKLLLLLLLPRRHRIRWQRLVGQEGKVATMGRWGGHWKPAAAAAATVTAADLEPAFQSHAEWNSNLLQASAYDKPHHQGGGVISIVCVSSPS